jgi:hypothetical protein
MKHFAANINIEHIKQQKVERLNSVPTINNNNEVEDGN